MKNKMVILLIFVFLIFAKTGASQILTPVGFYENKGDIEFCDIAVQNDTIYWPLGDKGLLIYDASDPTDLQRLKYYHNYEVRQYTRVYGSARSVDIKGDTAYLANGDLGFEVLDVSNPFNPRIIGKYYRYQSVSEFMLFNDFAILGFLNSGAEVVDMQDLRDIDLESRKNMEDVRVVDIDILGSYIYLSCLRNGIRIIPYREPLTDFKSDGFIKDYYPEGEAKELILYNKNGYLANGEKELLILDLNLPLYPAVKHRVETTGKTHALYLKDGILYVATNKGIEMYHREDTGELTPLSTFLDNERDYREIIVEGDRLYATYKKQGLFSNKYGLRIFRID